MTMEAATLDVERSRRFLADGFLAVDMESAAVAEVCEARGCPWSIYRCIGDRYFDGLLDERVIAATNPDGSGNMAEITRLIESDPEIGTKLDRLRRETAHAAKLAAEAAVRGCRARRLTVGAASSIAVQREPVLGPNNPRRQHSLSRTSATTDRYSGTDDSNVTSTIGNACNEVVVVLIDDPLAANPPPLRSNPPADRRPSPPPHTRADRCALRLRCTVNAGCAMRFASHATRAR